MADPKVTKLTGYAIAGASNEGVTGTKLTGYVIGGGSIDGNSSTKLTGYVIGGGSIDGNSSTKLMGYLVVDASEMVYKVTQTVTFDHCEPTEVTTVKYVTVPVVP